MNKQEKRPLHSTPAAWTNPFAVLSGDGLRVPAAAAPTAARPPAWPTQAAPKAPPRREPLRRGEGPAAARFRGRVVLRKETAQRGGKTVIVVHDFAPQITGAQIEELARGLKKVCGCGGTVRERTIEIQGDQPAKIRALLEAAGFRVAGV